MRFFLETKQQSQATTIENLKSETGWEFTVLLIKKKECIRNQEKSKQSEKHNLNQFPQLIS